MWNNFVTVSAWVYLGWAVEATPTVNLACRHTSCPIHLAKCDSAPHWPMVAQGIYNRPFSAFCWESFRTDGGREGGRQGSWIEWVCAARISTDEAQNPSHDIGRLRFRSVTKPGTCPPTLLQLHLPRDLPTYSRLILGGSWSRTHGRRRREELGGR